MSDRAERETCPEADPDSGLPCVRKAGHEPYPHEDREGKWRGPEPRDLAEFLLARIAEDEDAARHAAFGYGADWTNETDDGEGWSVVHADGQRDMVGCEDHDVTGHIARHDPARVLAECKAKRQIVDAYRDERSRRDVYQRDDAMVVEDEKQRTSRRSSAARTRGLEIALEALALPYADHEDYRVEWRP